MNAGLLPVLEQARELGFLGPGPIDDHVRHAEGFGDAYGTVPDGPCIDLGSGGGVPALVLAVLWPGTSWVLVDSSMRRTEFLQAAVGRLGLDSVTVTRQRAEEAGRDPALRGAAALVTARSFGPPAVTAECAAPLLRPGGSLVVSEPPEDAPGRWPDDGLAELGLSPVTVVGTAAHYARTMLVGPCPERYPRRPGIPAKRPLW